MRGETNSAPTGGGLKVIASGTLDPVIWGGGSDIDLPEPANYLFYTVTYSGNNDSLATYLIPRGWEGKGLSGSVMLSNDGMKITFTWGGSSPTAVAISYMALRVG